MPEPTLWMVKQKKNAPIYCMFQNDFNRKLCTMFNIQNDEMPNDTALMGIVFSLLALVSKKQRDRLCVIKIILNSIIMKFGACEKVA